MNKHLKRISILLSVLIILSAFPLVSVSAKVSDAARQEAETRLSNIVRDYYGIGNEYTEDSQMNWSLAYEYVEIILNDSDGTWNDADLEKALDELEKAGKGLVIKGYILDDSKLTYLDPSFTAVDSVAFYAWTWGNDDGRWVKGTAQPNGCYSFPNLDICVLFVRADPNMDISWNNGSVYNQTEDLDTNYSSDFVFHITKWKTDQSYNMQGEWVYLGETREPTVTVEPGPIYPTVIVDPDPTYPTAIVDPEPTEPKVTVEPKPFTGNREALSDLITELQFVHEMCLSSGFYTEDSRQSFLTAYKAAFDAFCDKSLSEEEYKSEYAKLLEAFNNLVEAKSEIRNLLDGFLCIHCWDHEDSFRSMFTEESFNIYEYAYKNAVKICYDDSAADEQLQQAYDNVKKAYDELVYIVSDDQLREELKQKIEEIERAMPDGGRPYTTISYKQFIDAMVNAVSVANDESSSRSRIISAGNLLTEYFNKLEYSDAAVTEPEETGVYIDVPQTTETCVPVQTIETFVDQPITEPHAKDVESTAPNCTEPKEFYDAVRAYIEELDLDADITERDIECYYNDNFKLMIFGFCLDDERREACVERIDNCCFENDNFILNEKNKTGYCVYKDGNVYSIADAVEQGIAQAWYLVQYIPNSAMEEESNPTQPITKQENVSEPSIPSDIPTAPPVDTGATTPRADSEPTPYRYNNEPTPEATHPDTAPDKAPTTPASELTIAPAADSTQPVTAATEKAENTLTAKAKKVTVKSDRKTILKAAKYVKVSKAAGKVTYILLKGNKKITVKKNGMLTIKKGIKKGTYTVKIIITAAGNARYNSAAKTVSVKIKVK